MLTDPQTYTEVIEGTWEELSRQAEKFGSHRLRVVILPDEAHLPASSMITKGIFPQLADITEDDFKRAEFHGDEDDGLDWGA